MTSLPLPGYIVAHDDADERGFKVLHTQEKKAYYFQTDDVTSRNRSVISGNLNSYFVRFNISLKELACKCVLIAISCWAVFSVEIVS